MYLAFAALAALAVLQAGWSIRFEHVRAADADIIQLVASQRAFAQEVGRMAALAAADGSGRPADALARALGRSRADALLLEDLIADQRRGAGRASPEVDAADEAWQAARERLWYRGEALVRAIGAGQPARVEGTAAAVQAEVETAVRAGGALASGLQQSAREHGRAHEGIVQGGVVATLVLLGLLALVVVEPTARAVRIQILKLAKQSQALRRLALVAERTSNIVVVTDAERRVEWVNDAFVRLTGHTAEEARGRRPGALLAAGGDAAGLEERLGAAAAAGQGLRLELAGRTRDGRELRIDADIQPLNDDSGALLGFVALGTDVTERRRLEAQLGCSARTDALTGLPNRAVVHDRIERALRHSRQHPGYGFAVLFLDFDRFKQVNDTLGHGAGDELLRQIARRIVDTLRPGDAVARVPTDELTAARIGGDEFVVVLEGVRALHDVRTVAHRLLEVLGEPYAIDGRTVQSSASIGIVTSDRAGASADDVLRDADTAMYEAKRAGRGRCVVFDASMHERVAAALELESDLRRALREGELFVVYQPIVRLTDRVLLGVEALVRWRHPVHGLVPPVRFIGVAEEAGLIDAIGRQVLNAACRQFAEWRDRLGRRAPRELAVNLSRAQLRGGGLVAEVARVLDANGIDPHQLQLEITESLAAQDEAVQETLRALKGLGVRLALDDFGTGYSSLACLHLLPVDTVKIDRSFVSHAEGVEYHRVLIEATIRVARTLGMVTVAEGIETPGQAALMERLHCDRGQGYHFARPLEGDALADWIERREAGALAV